MLKRLRRHASPFPSPLFSLCLVFAPVLQSCVGEQTLIALHQVPMQPLLGVCSFQNHPPPSRLERPIQPRTSQLLHLLRAPPFNVLTMLPMSLQAAEHAQQQQLLAEQARREAGELREAAQQREGLFRHQAMNLVTQAQQAVSYAREHEFNARQQAIGAAEQEEATRQQAEVLRLQAQTVVSEAHEEVGQTRALAAGPGPSSDPIPLSRSTTCRSRTRCHHSSSAREGFATSV